jgi:hypothetical protein
LSTLGLPLSTQQPWFCHPEGEERVAVALGAVEVLETVVEDEVVEEVVLEVTVDEVVLETVAVVTELSPIAENAVSLQAPPHCLVSFAMVGRVLPVHSP